VELSLVDTPQAESEMTKLKLNVGQTPAFGKVKPLV
jgi:hypothetical protein